MSHKKSSSLVPTLRFPEFQDAGEWVEKILEEVSDFINQKMSLKEVSLSDYISTENILPDYDGITIASKLPPTENVTCFIKNDILISNIRPYLKKIWFADKNGGASNDVIVVRAKTNISNKFLSFLLKNDKFINYVMKGAKGVKMPRGDISLIRKYPLALPTLPEQQKIAACLSSLDELITAHSQKLDALKKHKKGLMQQLFPAEGETVPTLRFPEFQDAGEWVERKLGEFIVERVESPKANVTLFSLTIEDGVTPKTERYERSFLVKNEADAYKLMLPDDFAYNPMNLRFGAIGKHSGIKSIAISKYYNVFYCDNTVDSKFCEIYFKSDRMLAFYNSMATGTLVEKKRVHFSDFLKFNISFPPLPEQQKIAACLSSLDELITAHSQKLDALKKHKKGLMQRLFPAVEV